MYLYKFTFTYIYLWKSGQHWRFAERISNS